jgi:N-acetyl-anhydromuramyl-L-alanine amidase AmpD
MNLTKLNSPNRYNGRGGWKPDMICCHVTESGCAGSVSWLNNPASSASAHFVIGKNGAVTQLIDLKDGSWCNGNSTDPKSRLYYKNSLNPIIQSRAANANLYTYSIEHEGYSYKDLYGALTEPQYQAAFEVIKLIIQDMKKSYNIDFVPDRNHLESHICDFSQAERRSRRS